MAIPAHVPVLLDRVVALLTPPLQDAGSVFVDATLGLGGHTEAVLRACPRARVVGVDRDPNAVERAQTRLAEFSGRVSLVHAVYDELPEVLDRLGHRRVQAVLFDLGVSSMQVDVRERGFAYAHDAPLDMRMDPSRGRTAADVLNTYAEQDLTRILRTYGEERFARRIAQRLVRERSQQPFERSGRLVEVVAAAVPAAARRTGHPAKRVFQALRIEVNDEIGALERALPAAIDALAVGGRVVVLSYHSLEDRLTKRLLRGLSRSTAPPDMPVVPAGDQPQLRLLTRGAEQAEPEEIDQNPRAASVRLRAAERIKEAA
ncbi:MAG: 16S rRNA (cytosine(1402)-N(4))-methyltransferase RsmH [Actinomycetota bacterium]|nr:16S rRNA (cytosine(1402)-N(4))-methyltransferase RsmH [Actinomycetota bacterium]